MSIYLKDETNQFVTNAVMCRFYFNGQEYPHLIQSEEDFEMFETILPTPSGDYFLAQVSSAGEFFLLDILGVDEVTIITTGE